MIDDGWSYSNWSDLPAAFCSFKTWRSKKPRRVFEWWRDTQCSWRFCLHQDLLCNNILPYKWDVAETLFLSCLFQVIFLNPLLFVSVVFITAVLTRGTISLCYSLLRACKDLRDVGLLIRGFRRRASHFNFFESLHSIKNCLRFHDTAESPAESKNVGMIDKMWCWSRGMCKIFLSKFLYGGFSANTDPERSSTLVAAAR